MLLVTPAAQAELGAARRLLPPSDGVLPFLDVNRPVQSDGTNFLIVLYTALPASDTEPMRQVLLVGPDGTQLTRPFVLRHGFFSGGWAGNYILRNGTSYQRVTSEGVLLDPEPRALPLSGTRIGYAGSTSYLVYDGKEGALLHPNGDSTPLVNLPAGPVVTVASNGPDFAITYKASVVHSRVRVVNDRGETLHDRALEEGTWITSDRASYLVNPDAYDYTKPYRILDRDLQLTRTLERSRYQMFHAIDGLGRGYSSVTTIYPWTGKVLLIEIRGPAYLPQSTVVDIGLSGSAGFLPFELSGNPAALFVLKGRRSYGFGVATAHVATEVSQIGTPLPPLQFRGALDRERPTAVTNAKGVSLLVWQESPDRQGHVYAARVSPGGALLDAAPLPVAAQQCSDLRTSVATDGTDFLVGWSGCTEAGASLVSAGGLVTPSFVRPRAGVPNNHAASVVWDGESYVFAWSVSDSTVLTRVLRSGAAALPPFSLSARNALLAPLPNGELMSVHNHQTLPDVFAQRLTRELRAIRGEFFVTPSATLRTLTRTGDRLLLTAHAEDGYTNAISLDFQGTARGRTRLDGALDPRVWCDTECAIVWKKRSTATEPAAIAGVPVRVTDSVTLGDPVVLVRYEEGYPAGEPALLRGPLAQPSLLLYSAPDPEGGGLQLFARTSLQKRRVARP